MQLSACTVDKSFDASPIPDKLIDITPGVCGNNDHFRVLEGPTEGSIMLGGIRYHWHGGCPRCVDEKVKELLKGIKK